MYEYCDAYSERISEWTLFHSHYIYRVYLQYELSGVYWNLTCLWKLSHILHIHDLRDCELGDAFSGILYSWTLLCINCEDNYFSGALYSLFVLGFILVRSVSCLGSGKSVLGIPPGGSFLPVLYSENSRSGFCPTICWGSSCFAFFFFFLMYSKEHSRNELAIRTCWESSCSSPSFTQRT